MSSLFLPISFVYKNMNFTNNRQKLNLVLHLLFQGISLLILFLLFAYFQIMKANKLRNNKLKKIKIQERQKQITLEQYSWFFNSLVNISVAFLISYQIPQLFLICNFITFGIGIYLSFKSTIRRFNNIILSCHIFLFHLGFIGMYIFQVNSYSMYHHFSSFSLQFLFIGAIHQIATAIIQSLMQIYKWFKHKITKISPFNSEVPSVNQQDTVNQQKNALKAFKVKIRLLKNITASNCTNKTVSHQLKFEKELKLKMFLIRKHESSQQLKSIKEQNKQMALKINQKSQKYSHIEHKRQFEWQLK